PEIKGIFQQTTVFTAELRSRLTFLRGCEKYRLNQIEITFFFHTLHQHGTYHAAPAYQTHFLHRHIQTSCRAATTAAPISCVFTRVIPSDQISPVRRPLSSTLLTAASMASAA